MLDAIVCCFRLQRFCQINKSYVGPFEQIFRDTYDTVHRLDTNKLRNASKLFAQLLFTDAISWNVLEHIRLTEDDTTSSSRIFLKILFQELAEYMGLPKFNQRLKDPYVSLLQALVLILEHQISTRLPLDKDMIGQRNDGMYVRFHELFGQQDNAAALRGRVSSRRPAQHALLNQLLHVDRSRRFNVRESSSFLFS